MMGSGHIYTLSSTRVCASVVGSEKGLLEHFPSQASINDFKSHSDQGGKNTLNIFLPDLKVMINFLKDSSFSAYLINWCRANWCTKLNDTVKKMGILWVTSIPVAILTVHPTKRYHEIPLYFLLHIQVRDSVKFVVFNSQITDLGDPPNILCQILGTHKKLKSLGPFFRSKRQD